MQVQYNYEMFLAFQKRDFEEKPRNSKTEKC
jgi:hypothetical protein